MDKHVKYIMAICQERNVSYYDVIKPKRGKRDVVETRFCIIYCLKKKFGSLTHERIANLLNRRDHTDISYGIKRVIELPDLLEFCKKWINEVEDGNEFIQIIQSMNPSYPMGNIITYNA